LQLRNKSEDNAHLLMKAHKLISIK